MTRIKEITVKELMNVNRSLNDDLIKLRDVIREKDKVILALKERIYNVAIARIVKAPLKMQELADELSRAIVLLHESE